MVLTNNTRFKPRCNSDQHKNKLRETKSAYILPLLIQSSIPPLAVLFVKMVSDLQHFLQRAPQKHLKRTENGEYTSRPNIDL